MVLCGLCFLQERIRLPMMVWQFLMACHASGGVLSSGGKYPKSAGADAPDPVGTLKALGGHDRRGRKPGYHAVLPLAVVKLALCANVESAPTVPSCASLFAYAVSSASPQKHLAAGAAKSRSCYQHSSAPAQVRPPPKPTVSTRMPLFSTPAWDSSSRAMGMLAAEVLP